MVEPKEEENGMEDSSRASETEVGLREEASWVWHESSLQSPGGPRGLLQCGVELARGRGSRGNTWTS